MDSKITLAARMPQKNQESAQLRKLVKTMTEDLSDARRHSAKLADQLIQERDAARAAASEARETEAELRAVIMYMIGRYVKGGTAVIEASAFDDLKADVLSGRNDFYTGENYGGDHLIYCKK